MKLFNALRGGSNKDAMRQTTSLTMAYLLEQNARFEMFMRQKVGELEAIVAQQQARQANESPVEAPGLEHWAEKETGAREMEQIPAGRAEFAQAETRPVKPVTTYFSDFSLDDVSHLAEELFVASAESSVPAGELPDTAELPAREPEAPAEVHLPPANLAPEPEAPASPPDWQALLLGSPLAVEAVSAVVQEIEGTIEAAEDLVAVPAPEDEVKESSLLLPAWLRRQQEQAMAKQAKAEPGAVSTGGRFVEPAAEQEADAAEHANPGVGHQALTGEMPAAAMTGPGANPGRGKPVTAPAATESVDELAEEGAWEMALNKQGPAGNWE